MSKNKDYLKMGTLAASLVVAVALLMANSVKADVVTIQDSVENAPVVDEITGDGDSKVVSLTGISGEGRVTFSTDSITGSGYDFSRTYKLNNPDAVFTSFVLDPEAITAALRSRFNNFSNEAPAIGDLNSYTGEIGWAGSLKFSSPTWGIEGERNFTFGDSQEIGTGTPGNPKITYEEVDIEGMPPGFEWVSYQSGLYEIDFEEMPTFGFVTDDLLGVNELTFEFTISNLFFESSIVDEDWWGANWYDSWAGIVSGAFYVGWEASPETSTPEPASLLLFGLGTAGAGVVAYRKRKGKK